MPENKKLKLSELGRISETEFREAKKIPLTIVLDNIRSMHNVGSFFRTADAFRLEKIILCGLTSKPPHRDIEKTALGSTNSVSWEYIGDVSEALESLKEKGYNICSIEQATNSISLPDFKVDITKKYAVILGNEVKGVQQSIIDQSDVCLEIPQFGTKHSLNVSVCAGVIIWHFFNQMKPILNQN